jgi:RHS repeat-associated protein
VHDTTGAALPPAAALTSLGYSGEHFDAKAQQQYLRARWYNPASGQFNRLDPFAGNMQDPQSLHKYAYVHGDPVQGIDPSGLMTLSSTLSTTTVRLGLAGAGVGAVVGGYYGYITTGTISGTILYGLLGALVGFGIGASAGALLTPGASTGPAAAIRIFVHKLAPQIARIASRTSPQSATGAYLVAKSFLAGMSVGVALGAFAPDEWREPITLSALAAYGIANVGSIPLLAAVPAATAPAVLTISFVAGVNAGYFGTIGLTNLLDGSAFDAFEDLVLE